MLPSPRRRPRPVRAALLALLALGIGGGCGREGITSRRAASPAGEEVPAGIPAAGPGQRSPALAPSPAGGRVNQQASGNNFRDAAARAMAASGEPERRDAVRAAVRAWSENDFAAALAWVQALLDFPVRQTALTELGRALAGSDFPAALALSADLPEGAVRDDFLQLIAQTWASHGGDARAAAAWARGLGDAELRAKVLANVAVELAQTAPAEAAELVRSALPPGPERAAAAVTVASRWAVSDPAAAAAWAAQLSDPVPSDNLLRAVLTRWVQADAPAAAAWIGSLPAGTGREAAVAGYVNAWSDTDPAGALDWAVANGRDPQVAEITRRWLAARPDAARAWVAAAALPPDTKYHLIYGEAP